MKIIQKKLSNQKKILSARLRYAALSLCLLLTVMGLFLLLSGMKRMSVTKEEVLFSYALEADSSYKVYLKENSLFEGEFLEEGMVYADRLTDYISIELSSALTGNKNVNIGASYTIDAVLEGYKSGVSSNKIYEKRYHLKNSAIETSSSNHAKIEESVEVRPDMYALDIAGAEEELGGTTDKRFYILFEGDYRIELEDRNESRHFSYILPIPVNSQTSFYTIEKPEKLQENGNIAKTSTEETVANKKNIALGLLLAGIGALLSAALLRLTRLPGKKEKMRFEVSEQLRRHGSRFIALGSLPDLSGKILLEMKDMEDMILLAEELHRPVLYAPAQDGFPEDGVFTVLFEEYAYIIRYPLVLSEEETKINESSIKNTL